MRMVDLIEKKQSNQALTKEEIDFMIEGFTNGNIPDYQMSAMNMAIFFNDMTDEERSHLTMAMVKSGDVIDLSKIHGVKVDKHSTGGVGDTTTLVLAAMVASLGIPVAKMSGRGLGHTGGTIDKLESIPGFKTEVEMDRFIELVNENQMAVIGQTGNLTPADKKLYALRDVTSTVQSIPLIASSIMSKKIASGADAIVLDVKVGDGAFMKQPEEAEQLAHAMVRIGRQVGRQVMAVISDMNQPLGFAVGNTLEVIEAIETLKGNGPKDLVELCLVLGSQMVHLANPNVSIEEAKEQLAQTLQNGKALLKFKQFVAHQGGNPDVVDDYSLMPTAPVIQSVKSVKTGKVTGFDCENIGIAAMLLGAGRATKESEIDLGVGLVLLKKLGDTVEEGEPLVQVHSSTTNIHEVEELLLRSIHIGDKVEVPPLIYNMITK